MHKTFNYNNANIGYNVLGNGLPVIFLHGFGEDGGIWHEQSQFLQEHCTLLIPDLPGSGSSSLLDVHDVKTALEDYAECLNALLIYEEISKCIVIGHSMGGYITLAFAEKYPGKLLGFGFVNSTAYADTDEKKTNRRKALSTISSNGPHAFLKESMPALFGEAYKKQYLEKVEMLIEAGKNFSRDSLLQYTQAMMHRPDRSHVLKSSEVPVLFIMGTDDVAAPLNDVLQQVHLPRVSYIHILKNVGHMSMLEAAEEVNNHLLEFIVHLDLNR